MNLVSSLSGGLANGFGATAAGASASYGSQLLSGLGADSIGAAQMGTSILQGLAGMSAAKTQGITRGADYRVNANQLRAQAGEWQTQAGDEFVTGQNQVSGLKSQYLNALGQSSTRLGASGVDVGQGVGAQQRQAIGQSATEAERVTMLASDIRARRDAINETWANANANSADAAAGAAEKQGDAAAKMGLLGGILSGGLKLLTAGIP